MLNLDEDADVGHVRSWIQSQRIGVLNIAGPRASECQGIYERARWFLHELFARI
jgi:hypothetical protein